MHIAATSLSSVFAGVQRNYSQYAQATQRVQQSFMPQDRVELSMEARQFSTSTTVDESAVVADAKIAEAAADASSSAMRAEQVRTEALISIVSRDGGPRAS